MKIKKLPFIMAIMVVVLALSTITAYSSTLKTISEAAAVKALGDSLEFTDGGIAFTLPENYGHADKWNILIAGRIEADGFGMSTHLFTEENDTKSWQAGKRYFIPIDGQNYTDLLMSASLVDQNGKTQTFEADLLDLKH